MPTLFLADYHPRLLRQQIMDAIPALADTPEGLVLTYVGSEFQITAPADFMDEIGAVIAAYTADGLVEAEVKWTADSDAMADFRGQYQTMLDQLAALRGRMTDIENANITTINQAVAAIKTIANDVGNLSTGMTRTLKGMRAMHRQLSEI